ncbi:hypothetical protein CKAH01_06044 [Colletotrichum kahawae]|uniref:Uncharacterized protein n=1 Tax=Colletotrichum kahawae TaxID=34407 RepID=A0AAD9YBP6_COLKA|nr:hypothetical protein CKAH01_06044 [Colletotrichum kahawae]
MLTRFAADLFSNGVHPAPDRVGANTRGGAASSASRSQSRCHRIAIALLVDCKDGTSDATGCYARRSSKAADPTENRRWENQPGNLQDLRDYTALHWRHAGRAESLSWRPLTMHGDSGRAGDSDLWAAGSTETSRPIASSSDPGRPIRHGDQPGDDDVNGQLPPPALRIDFIEAWA